MKKILAVDDGPATLELVKTLLSDAGFSVSTVQSGTDCLEVLKKEKFDLVLLDIMMPDMSGWDLFIKIKKQGINANIVFLSVFGITENRKKTFKEQGVLDYMEKPFVPDEFTERIRNVLG